MAADLTRHSFTDTTFVTVLIGPDEKPFHAYKSLLCQVSTFFRAALEGQFKEGADNVVKMPEERETTFKMFLRWLYFEYTGTECPDNLERDPERKLFARMRDLVELYSLADRLGIETLTADTVKEFHKLIIHPHFSYPPDIFELLYNLDIPAKPLRKLTVRFFVWKVDTHSYTSENMEMLMEKCPDFSKEVVAEMGWRYGSGKGVNSLDWGYEWFMKEDGEKHTKSASK